MFKANLEIPIDDVLSILVAILIPVSLSLPFAVRWIPNLKAATRTVGLVLVLRWERGGSEGRASDGLWLWSVLRDQGCAGVARGWVYLIPGESFWGRIHLLEVIDGCSDVFDREVMLGRHRWVIQWYSSILVWCDVNDSRHLDRCAVYRSAGQSGGDIDVRQRKMAL